MRLSCDIVVQNWSCSLQGVGARRKPTRASVCVGRKPCTASNKQNNAHETAFLLVCTANNRDGAKYKISGNITNVFAKFLESGKATIRFKEPPHDICISKAEPSSLRKLLSTLKLTIKDPQKLKLSVLMPAKSTDIVKIKSELMIYKRADYPSSASFPQNLTKLAVVNCGMVRIDVRILALKYLVSLNLSNNSIKELNVSLDRLKELKMLNLASNKLTKLPSKLCRTSLATSLTCLDLSKNSLSCLPISFGTMASLVNVKLDNNKLCCLPSNIGNLVNLRYLSVSHNQLQTVPYSFLCLNLESLDISGNPFLETNAWFGMHLTKSNMPSLQEHAARMIINSRTYYSQHMIGRYLCDYLDSAKMCWHCRSSCFDYLVYSLTGADLNTLVSHTVVSTYGNRLIPTETNFCSNACFAKWQTTNE